MTNYDYTSEELQLAERIMGTAFDPHEGAKWIAEYREELEEQYAKNVMFVHEQLQTVRTREAQLLAELNALNTRIFEKADTIPAPASYTTEEELEHV